MDLKQKKKYQKLETEEEITVDDEEEEGEEGDKDESNNGLVGDNETSTSYFKKLLQKARKIKEDNQVKFGWACTISGILWYYNYFNFK